MDVGFKSLPIFLLKNYQKRSNLKFVCLYFKNHYFLTSFLLGVFYTLGFAPFSVWAFSFLALLGLYKLTLRSNDVKQAVLCGVLFGLGHYLTSIHWLVGSFLVTIEPVALAWLLGGLSVFLLSLFLSLFMAASVGLTRKYSSFFGCYGSMFFFAFLWVFFEFLRSLIVPTFAWNLTGHVWAFQDEFLQVLPYLSVFGLSFIFVLTAVMVSRLKTGVLAIAILASCYGHGLIVLNNNKPLDIVTPKENALHMRLVPGYVLQKEKWLLDKKSETLRNYIDRSKNDKTPDVLVWPETALTYFVEKDGKLKEFLREETSSPVFIFGAPNSDDGKYYNNLYVMNEVGEIFYGYSKRFLIPFGEYFPFRAYFPEFFEKFLQGQGSYSSGLDEQGILRLGGKSFSPLICGEIVLPFVRNVVHTDADYILNITNDGWFRGFIGPDQHLAIAKFQAAVIQKPIVRVAHGGMTVVIDSFGRVIHSLMGEEGNQFLDIYL
jgi:apolipoprotein N-acyltransferase